MKEKTIEDERVKTLIVLEQIKIAVLVILVIGVIVLIVLFINQQNEVRKIGQSLQANFNDTRKQLDSGRNETGATPWFTPPAASPPQPPIPMNSTSQPQHQLDNSHAR